MKELDGTPVHRPERTWPVRPPDGPIVLAAPPVAPEPESGGAWTTLLPLLGSLGIVAFAFVVRSVLYLVVATFMVVAMVGGTLGMRVVQRRRDADRQDRLRRRYLAHAAEAGARAKAAAVVQRDGLLGLYPDTPGVLRAAREQGALWERRPAHADFGHVRLGLGPVPAAAPIQVSADGGPLATPVPELAAVAQRLVAATRMVPEAPVVVPLRSLSSIAVVGDPPAARALAGSWLASLAAFHAPTDLRIIGWVPGHAARAWDWVKWLPHTRDPLAGEGFGRAERAVTTDVLRFAEQVEAVAGPRLGQAARRAAEPEAWAAGPAGKTAEHVVVLVDAYAPDADVAATKHLDTLLERGADLAVTVIALVSDPGRVPSTCGARVELGADGTATYREAGPAGRAELAVSADRLDRAAAEHLARWLAPLRLTGSDAGADLTDTVRLVDLLGLEHAGQVSLWDWLAVRDLAPGPSEAGSPWDPPARDPAELLQTPIGIGADGSPLVLDLKDMDAGGMGPHGILVGATGSGKSELLRSLVTGLAARHHPRLVNLVLVDFKGGAAFADLADLPHTVGLITNLADELTLVDRMQAALRGSSTGASGCSATPGTSTRSATTTPPRPPLASPPTCPTCRTSRTATPTRCGCTSSTCAAHWAPSPTLRTSTTTPSPGHASRKPRTTCSSCSWTAFRDPTCPGASCSRGPGGPARSMCSSSTTTTSPSPLPAACSGRSPTPSTTPGTSASTSCWPAGSRVPSGPRSSRSGSGCASWGPHPAAQRRQGRGSPCRRPNRQPPAAGPGAPGPPGPPRHASPMLPTDLAAPTGGAAVKGRRVRLLTVAGAGATADVVVAADVPVGELRPALAELVGGWQLAPDDPRWVLLTAAGTVLRPDATLHDQEVQDGEILYLRASRQPSHA